MQPQAFDPRARPPARWRSAWRWAAWGLVALAVCAPLGPPASAHRSAQSAGRLDAGRLDAPRVHDAPPAAPRRYVQVAHFGQAPASADARQVAHWALYTGDNQGRSVVIVDKKQAHAFVFDPAGRLLGHAPVLLGSAIGDKTVPGVGDKPIAQVLPSERTTPAGRFIATFGMSTTGEDVVWVDYDAAVSMHRVRPWVKAERRLERLASPTPADNRISYGCINLPRAFYEQVLSPAVRRDGAVVYVLPEEGTPEQVFGARAIPNAEVLALFQR